jgi:four helix bundle protein
MLQRKENIIVIKSEAFADRITKMCAFLLRERRGEKDILRQISRSGTSIGANIAEGIYAQSGPDFISKFSIALKEANETRYWLDRLHQRNVLKQDEYNSMHSDNMEIIYILTSIIRTMKTKQQAIEEAKKGDKIDFPLINDSDSVE